MYMRVAALVPVAALAAVAAAAPSAVEARDGSCNTGPIQCCNQTFTQGSTSLNELLGLLGITIPNVSGLVGFNCNSILGSNSCTQQPVCCTGNTYNGLITVGCSPVTINA